MDMFEKAAREKYRYEFRGLVATEDLWDLDLESLDYIYKDLKAELREQSEESLLNKKSNVSDTLETQIAIVTHIVRAKQAEIAEREALVKRAKDKQKILAIMEEKQDEALKGKSLEELEKLLAEL